MLDEGKLAAAVEDALRFVGSGEDKLVRLLEYITRLETDPNWSPGEISAFHARVSQALAKPQPQPHL